MRLTCPNCNAQYEVPDEVIPEEGRDVQCSSCEQTWFQPKHPEAEPVAAETDDGPAESAPSDASEPPAAEAAAPEPEQAEDEQVEAEQPDPEPEDEARPAAPTGNVDPAVATILREEAAREAELRAKEGSGLESQPDLGLDQQPEPAPKPTPPAATETASGTGQKEALPDVDSINSTLRSDDAPAEAEPAEAPPRKSGGFLRGFALILIIGVILFLIYGNARQISEAVPQAEPVLQSYVSMVDQARVWLESQAGSATE
uniref:zinc-ribbon domain-containing protein n=1 Tax=Ruegeria arenilitoris TaxID=1173585 RepID=UPI00147DFA38|nr:zinc-ribbon domain-containing protein [Ruegeria arenilitoris]